MHSPSTKGSTSEGGVADNHSSQMAGKDTNDIEASAAIEVLPYRIAARPNTNAFGRDGIRRACALALDRVGFGSASTEALESFATTVETYLSTFIDALKQTALGSRREQPNPQDFEIVLRRFQLPISSLKPHLKTPIVASKLQPRFCVPSTVEPTDTDPVLPALHEELDGRMDQETRLYIPKSFPDFPSIHTYKYTGTEQEKNNIEDPTARRNAASKDATKGEEALRRLDRASKITKQKELKEKANRHPMSKVRHEYWEAAMLDLLGAANGAVEVADNSVIVNSENIYHRREIQRVSRRALGEGTAGGG